MDDDPDAAEPGRPDPSIADAWERTLEGRSTKERVYEVVTTLTEPTPVSAIAERADCSANGARSNLEWFADLGIVEAVATGPTLYRRNEAYFEFLRAHRLARENDPETLAALAEDYETRDAELAEGFDADDPDGVDPMSVGAGDDFEAVVDRLSEWRAVRRRLRDLRRARLLAERGDRSGTVPV